MRQLKQPPRSMPNGYRFFFAGIMYLSEKNICIIMIRKNFEVFKNVSDIEDLTTWREIEHEADQEILMEQITLEFDRGDLDAEKIRLLERFEKNVLIFGT